MSNINIKKMSVGAIGTNCFIIHKKANAFIVDPGGDFGKIKSFLEKNNLVPEMIINTHGHYDHIGANKKLKSFYDLEIWIHENDAEKLNNPEKNASIFSVEKICSPQADRMLNDGDSFKFSGYSWKILHTPGHTEGSICIINKKQKIIFTGDTLFKQGWGRTDLPGGDNNKMRESLKKILDINGNYHCYCGHGPDFMLEDRRFEVKKMLSNYF